LDLLIASTVPVDARFGAGQITFNLARACRALGREVEIWRPATGRRLLAAWTGHQRLRKEFADFARRRTGFSAIESPSWLSSSRLRELDSRLVVRGVQPELEYMRAEREASRERGEWSVAAGLRDRYVERLVEAGWSRADTVLVLGEAERQAMLASRPQLGSKLRSYVVAPSLEDRAALRRVAAARPARRLNAENARFLWIGRWVAHKGTHDLLSFAKVFLTASPAARLTIAGAGNDPRSVIERLGGSIGEQIEIVGQFERAELPDLLARHDAGLFTSRCEGWGISVQEMLESGLPVYGSPAGAVPELVRWFPSQLRSFPPRPDDRLPDADSEAAFADYAEDFQWPRIAQDYLSSIGIA
jgi:hypothetical protein